MAVIFKSSGNVHFCIFFRFMFLSNLNSISTSLVKFDSFSKILLDRKFAQAVPSREERKQILTQWFPEPGGFRFPGFNGRYISDNVQLKMDPKDKWTKKYIELRDNSLCIFKVEY